MKLMEMFTKKRGNAENAEFERRYSELLERLYNVRSTFNFVSDEQAIEAAIYEENAVIRLLEQLYRDAREKGITLEIHERGKNRP